MIDKTKIAIKNNSKFSRLFIIWFKDYYSQWLYNGDLEDYYYYLEYGRVHYGPITEISEGYELCEITDLFEI